MPKLGKCEYCGYEYEDEIEKRFHMCDLMRNIPNIAVKKHRPTLQLIQENLKKIEKLYRLQLKNQNKLKTINECMFRFLKDLREEYIHTNEYKEMKKINNKIKSSLRRLENK